MTILSNFDLVSDEDIKTYERDGVVCLRGVLSPLEIEGLRQGVSSQLANYGKTHTAYDFEAIAKQVFSQTSSNENGEIDAGQADRFDLTEVQEILANDKELRPIRDVVKHDEGGMFFYDAAGWRFHEGIRKAALDSSLPSICTKLLDTTYLNFWEDTTFVKTPNTGQRTSFHQDYSYFQIQGEKCCIVWIPLDPVNYENGTMEYVRGSHKWGKKFAPNLLVSQSVFPDSPYEKTPDIEANPENYDIVSFDVQPGDVIIHHVMTVHGSRGNQSADKMRRAMSFRYCGDDITYYDRPGAIVQPYLKDKLKNGDRLFSKDYPIVFPRPYPEFELADKFEFEDTSKP